MSPTHLLRLWIQTATMHDASVLEVPIDSDDALAAGSITVAIPDSLGAEVCSLLGDRRQQGDIRRAEEPGDEETRWLAVGPRLGVDLHLGEPGDRIHRGGIRGGAGNAKLLGVHRPRFR